MKQLYKFKILLITGVCAGVLMISCIENFENYNTHATNPSPGDMTTVERVGTLFPGMLYLMHNFQENDNQMIEQMVGQYGGYLATTSNWQGTNFGTFNPSANWVEYPFNNLFSGFYANYFKVVEVTEGKGYIYAWANIVRVAVMLRVTDIYGPIPYSMMNGGNLMVSYDEEQAVYHNMIADLTNSVNTLTGFLSETQGKTTPIAEYDLVYKGDFGKWIKFANSLKLRMAVRIANVDAEYAKQMMAEAIAGGVIEKNDDNAFLPTTDNPYYKSAYNWSDIAVNATLSTYMNSWNDPRRDAYMKKADNGAYTGVRMGIDGIDESKYNPTDAMPTSKPNFAADSPLLVFCAAETHFLKAEAALQGWVAGNAQTHYEEGIRTSMEQHKVAIGNYLSSTLTLSSYTDPITAANSYAANNFTSITVQWNNGSANTRLEKIITQKWLANYPLGLEAWSEFRRTGFPQMMPAVNNKSADGVIGVIANTKGRLVRRLPYPISEYNGNPEHVRFAVLNMLRGGLDVGSADLWWAKTN
jgi:hypothetical protein